MTNTLAIIPARGGSKRLPGKNIKLLNGQPLVTHTIDIAVGQFTKVVFTSDDDDIIKVVNEYVQAKGYDVLVEKRPEELATDTSKVIDTVSYYFDKLGRTGTFHQIWLLLPTCPLRDKNDIKQAKELLEYSPETDGVLSITDPEFPPSLGLVERWDGFLSGLDPYHPFASGNSRSQDQPITYRPNGAMYGMWWGAFRKHRNFYRGNVKGYHMPRERSIDIDTELDFIVAEAVIKNERKD